MLSYCLHSPQLGAGSVEGKHNNEVYTPSLLLEGCGDYPIEHSIGCVGDVGQIETTFENTYRKELRQRCTKIVMQLGPEKFRPLISSVLHSKYC